MKKIEGPGGTPGGFGMFVIGLMMSIIGFYLLSRNVIIHSGFSGYFYGVPFGLTLLPLIFGIGFLFFNGRSWIGWLLLVSGVGIIIAEVVMSMRMYIKPLNLYEVIIIFILAAGGIGTMARSFFSVGRAAPAQEPQQ